MTPRERRARLRSLFSEMAEKLADILDGDAPAPLRLREPAAPNVEVPDDVKARARARLERMRRSA